MNVFIIGGGCYGSGYVRQFRKAAARGRMPAARWIVLDRDPACRAAGERQPGDPLEIRVGEWRALLAAAVTSGELGPGDQVIPSPFQGSLIADWLQDEAARAGRTLSPEPMPAFDQGVRFEQADPLGRQRFVSFAGWTCPVHCIEPATCPATRGPKAWDLRDAVRDFAAAQGVDAVFSFPCLHWIFGVGAVPAEAFLAARAHVAQGAPGRMLLASLSTCHGALSMWTLEG